MNKRLFGLVLSVVAVLIVLGIHSAAPTPIARAQGLEGSTSVAAWDTDGNKGSTKSFIGTTNSKSLVLKTNNAERVRILPDGKIGIGTNAPSQTLQVNGMTLMGENGGVYGSTARDNTGLYPTIAFNSSAAPNYAAGADGYGGVWQFQNTDGKLTYYTGPNVTAGTARVNTPRVTINANGFVGIGTTNPDKTLVVKGSFMVYDSQGVALVTRSDRTVAVGELAQSTTNHLCYYQQYVISSCSSAAEYVPTIDAGKGFPQTADLVSIAPDVKNPYGDAHGPFVVQKTAKPCDPNLLGYIVKPESGADGVYKNEHYLPLAIYGYFPAQVTMENGAIKRGDPITSSSKGGYGMKATDACKIIGYALEDANADGTIQVFANFGDNAAAQVNKLQQENNALKQLLLQFETRLAVLEDATPNNGVAAQSNTAAQAAMRVTDPLSVVKGYYAATGTKDIETALTFLADDIAWHKTETADGFSETVKGVQAVENALESSEVFSFSVEDFRVDGDQVTYAMTEWIDPRRVGMNYPQPRRSRLTAVVADGKIVSLAETLYADLALRTQ